MKRLFVTVSALLILIFTASCASSGTPAKPAGPVPTAKSVSEVLAEGMETAAETETPAELPTEEAPAVMTETSPILPYEEESSPAAPQRTDGIDVDLTVMDGNMVYAEVYDMMNNPEAYKGLTVRMNGTFSLFKGETQTYYACVIADATACCAQGLEFVLADGGTYPEVLGTPITVTGTFETYTEGEAMFCHLVDATML